MSSCFYISDNSICLKSISSSLQCKQLHHYPRKVQNYQTFCYLLLFLICLDIYYKIIYKANIFVLLICQEYYRIIKSIRFQRYYKSNNNKIILQLTSIKVKLLLYILYFFYQPSLAYSKGWRNLTGLFKKSSGQ